MVELRGFEPLTPTLPVWCATNCAKTPSTYILAQYYFKFKKKVNLLLDITEKSGIIFLLQNFGELCNGSTTDSDSVCWGSNPYSPAKNRQVSTCRFFIHCESNGISSRASVHLITEGVYHQPQAAFLFAMMIYKTSF